MAHIFAALRKHPLIDLLFTLQRNPRVAILIEPLWGIPNSLIAPFTAVYMRALGVSNMQIGFALSASMLSQVICAFSGGIITDKLGRKLTTILGDLFGWVIPMAILACAQNYWFFLIAMTLHGFEQVNQTAWVCLLVEDAPEKDLLNIWNWIVIAGLLAVFFSPISGGLILRFSLIPVMRVLYVIYSLFMLVKCIITYTHTTETRQGKIRKAETREQSSLQIAAGYWQLVPQMLRNDGILRVLVIMVVVNITAMIGSNFYSLYATSALGLPESYLAYFPIIRAIVMLLFFFVIQHKLTKFRTKAPMCLGLCLYMVCQLLLIFSPAHTLWSLLVYTFLEAVSYGLVYPRKEQMAAVFINKQERARITALLTTLMLAIAAPFGAITGALFNLDGRLPFVLSLSLFLAAFAVIFTMKENPGSETEA